MKIIGCVNPKCDVKKGKLLYLFSVDGLQAGGACSDACFWYATYIRENGDNVDKALKYLKGLHPFWVKKITPFLEDFELAVLKQESAEQRIKTEIIKSAEKTANDILVKLKEEYDIK